MGLSRGVAFSLKAITFTDSLKLSKAFAVLNCSQLVTVRGPQRPRFGDELSDLSIITDGALLVRGDQIHQVGSRDQIEPQLDQDCEVIDAGGRIVLPGFVDAHTHPVFAGNRAGEFEERSKGATYQEIAARGGGIQSTVLVTRAASHDELLRSAAGHAEWFLRCGTTTVEGKSGYGLSLEDELKILRVIKDLNEHAPLRIIPTFLGAHDLPPEFRGRREAYIRLLIDEMLPAVAEGKLAEYCDVFCEQSVFSIDESWKILSAARCHGLGLRIHADQLTLNGGAKLAAELDAVTADHLEHTDTEGIAALKSSGVQPILLPGSVYALGSNRYPQAREMIAAGLGIVLATDFNPGSSPTPSLPMVFSIAATHMGITPAESIVAATVNAAYSLGRGDAIGSLEEGKLADFVIHNAEDYRELAYFFGLEHPWRVYIGGNLAFAR